jgi:hypothetical protein
LGFGYRYLIATVRSSAEAVGGVVG